MRGIKGYKSMSEERLISSINESEPVKEKERNFDGAKIEKIKKDFNELRDQKPIQTNAIILNMKVKEIRTKLCQLKNISI